MTPQAWALLLLCAMVAWLRARRRPPPPSSPRPAARRTTIVCPGGGVFFWWQIAAVKRLLELYELPESVPLAGASAGALAVVFGQCGVDPAAAHAVAFGLADEAGVFRNPLGLLFQWGGLVHRWLDVLLPADAAARCNGRCRVAVTRVALCGRPLRGDAITRFETRASLVAALMASTHIPFFMDGRMTSRHVRHAADGGIRAWLGLAPKLDTLVDDPADFGGAIEIDHRRDDAFLAACRKNNWSPLSVRGTENFMSFGAAWVEKEAQRGDQGALEGLAPYRRRCSTPATTTSTPQRSDQCVTPATNAQQQRKGVRRSPRLEARGATAAAR